MASSFLTAMVSAAIFLGACPFLAASCSYFEVKSPKDIWVIGRTMELGMSGGGMQVHKSKELFVHTNQGLWDAVLHPRGQDGNFTNRFGYVGIDSKPGVLVPGATVTLDGMNEAGVTISCHTMRMAEYEKLDSSKQVLRFDQVAPWILGQFDSVLAIERALANVSVISAGASNGNFIHWAIADAHGNSAVLEYVAGQRMFHSNDVRVLTNDPDYAWHVKNLNVYVGVTPEAPTTNRNIQVNTEVGMVPQVWSQGFNLAALPSDLSPTSRFVRLFYLRQYALLQDPVASVDDAIVLATGLLNSVFIPRGTAAPMHPAETALDFDFTHYALLKIPAKSRLLFRDYLDMSWRQIDLAKLDFTKRRGLSISTGSLGIQDVTGKLQVGEDMLELV